jgi:lantibiotic biosynthesis protein
MSVTRSPLYQNCGLALLRAAVFRLDADEDDWPDIADSAGCQEWIRRTWASPSLSAAVQLASPTFGAALDALLAHREASPKRVRRATLSLARYALRARSRHVPFGLFAGVAPVGLSDFTRAKWGVGHRPIARVDTQWLAEVVTGLEAIPDLRDRLDVMFTDLAVERGERLEAPQGTVRISIRCTPAIRVVLEATRRPVRFTILAEQIAARFPGVAGTTVRALLAELVTEGLLITCLRAPMTVPAPLDHVINRLDAVRADDIPAAAPVLGALRAVAGDLIGHNQAAAVPAEQAAARASLSRRAQGVSDAGRTPVAADLRLDCTVTIPAHVASEVERAATALARLTRQPTGDAAWRDFYAAFCERYGTGTVVPVCDVVNPDSGIGLPSGYAGATLPAHSGGGPSKRDAALLALAWAAVHDGHPEVVLTDSLIDTLSVAGADRPLRVPPHVEVTARVHAVSADALSRGDYLLSVAPGRSTGTFTSRFTATATKDADIEQPSSPGGLRLREVYARVPTAVAGACPVQLSFPPAFAHAENVCRVPEYLPDVLSLGEHRTDDHRSDDHRVLGVDDLAVTATRDGLHLVTLADRRVVEPQVFHGLALEKQPPPLARFLIHISRGLGARWHRFDWGPPSEALPHLPRVRYGRVILAPARWRLTPDDVPSTAEDADWQSSLDRWRLRWRCPAVVELQDADRSLRLTLTEPLHTTILRRHLDRQGSAVLVETAATSENGWIDGHAHDIVFPLVTTQPPIPAPDLTAVPVTRNATHGQLPAGPGTDWVNAKVFTHPDCLDALIADHLPTLIKTLGCGDDGDNSGRGFWFIRYRSTTETDHLRLRIHCNGPDGYVYVAPAVAMWAGQLRTAGTIARLVFDTHHPETGRYGHGTAMHAAENAFIADSRLVAALLRRCPASVIPRDALIAINLVATAHSFLSDPHSNANIDPDPGRAMRWLTARPATSPSAPDRAVRDLVVRLALHTAPGAIPTALGGDPTVTQLWDRRSAALAAYRARLPVGTDTDQVLESLLHMHHNRLAGIDRDRETGCRRLARHAALAWTAHHPDHR